MITCADKISNIYSMICDYKNLGEEMWACFKASKQQKTWYYTILGDALSDLEGTSLFMQYKKYCKEMFDI